MNEGQGSTRMRELKRERERTIENMEERAITNQKQDKYVVNVYEIYYKVRFK